MKKLIVISVLALAVAGCGQSKIESIPKAPTATEAPTEAPTPTPEEVKIDFDKCFEQMKNEGATVLYDFVQDFYVGLSDSGVINITIVVDDATDPKQALEYTHMLIKELNYYASQQDPTLEPSSSETYGGLYDRYNALVGVATTSTVNDSDAWLVYDAITTGTQFVELK